MKPLLATSIIRPLIPLFGFQCLSKTFISTMGCRHQSSLAQILFSSTFILGAFALPASNAGPTVTIASGVVIGTTTQPAGSTNYANAYLGVPFAKSPPERFSPPEAAPSWSSPLTATAFRPACIQQFTNTGNAQVLQKQYFGNPTGALTEESEDCLYLNVFTPPNASSSSKKAVMFWLFPVRTRHQQRQMPITLTRAGKPPIWNRQSADL